MSVWNPRFAIQTTEEDMSRDSGCISEALKPSKEFIPKGDPGVFTVAQVRELEVQYGGVSAVKAPAQPFAPSPYPEDFFFPEYYAERGRRLVEIAPPLVKNREWNARNFDEIEAGIPFEKETLVLVKISKKIVKVCNFTVKIVAEIHHETLHGTEAYLLLELNSIKGCFSYQIRKSAFLNLAAKLRNDKPALRLYPYSGKQEAFFRVYLSQKMEEAEGHLPFNVIYGYAGWQQLISGAWHYFSGLDVRQCLAERCLADLSVVLPEEQLAADRFALHVLDLGDIFTMLPLFLHMHTGVLKRLFEEAGVPVLFILNLFGPTGIGKTMLMLLLFCLFTKDKRLANFTSSASGLERFFEQFHDAMAILDDMSSVIDADSRRLLERLLRQYCDGNGRITAARGSDGYRVNDMNFGLIMTAETLPEGGKQSSQLRFLNVPITALTLKDDVVREFKIRVIQNPKQGFASPLDIYMTRFIHYIESRFAELVHFIATYEPPPISTQFRRHEATYRVLVTEAQIILKYFVYARTLTEEQSHAIFAEHWLPTLQQLMQFNSQIGLQSDPVRVYLDTLQQGIGERMFLIADNRSVFEREANAFIGFWATETDGLKLFIDPDRSYQYVKAKFDRMRLIFTVAPRQLLQMLASAGLSEGYQRKDRKAPKPLKELRINGVSIKMLVLKWEAVQRYLAEK